MPPSPPPLKTPFSNRRVREFLNLSEVDAVIAATQKTRASIRNQALVLLLFCQTLQPIELCWLRWQDINFAEKFLVVARNRRQPTRYQPQVAVNLQLLCPPEIDILQQLKEQRTTDWVFASERRQRLSERSLHHLIQLIGEKADLLFPIHPYMLRRTGLYYRSALLLQKAELSLRQCCLLWNWHRTTVVEFSLQEKQELSAITQFQADTFFAALAKLKTFSGIQGYENLLDYLLGAFLLFPRLEGIPDDYWLAPTRWNI